MKNRMRQYVGITGFTTPQETQAIMAVASPEVPFMVGVLASSTTLEGGANRWKHRYPKREAIAGIFPPKSERTLNLLHFNTSREHILTDWLGACQQYGGSNLQGVQLNIAWPDTKMLHRWRMVVGGDRLQIVLQVGGKAMAQCQNDPNAISHRIKRYEGLVEYVLIDGSGGTGQPLDAEFVSDCFSEILARDIDVGLGVGGGLEPGQVAPLLGLVKERHPFFSVDAEGRLRDEDDRLDLPRSIQYVAEVNEFFGYAS